ncbi:cytochrome c oxidase subunit II [Bacillus badius]|uniref:Cytochrome aa3 subunit 2 n=1 Tax=Bacillus badius TaxID=1455 RepID=A0ABR5ASP8_BACBA|nr:cytochrome c oxidase subunit II [Bacillus badius]KIL75641.1 Cytochrome c oxidase (B(O/a)3-type) chain II [Bacillus badius]KIL77773.1 Cytochrome c oxidase (B(O/a)3-type) chain II [Bacillus badius]KZO01442.1 cytochrome B5 [Bacillus badius]KZR59243.1 cytochrome B5 [Bacillus badius]MED0666478.1 cytochrome c oxidase subunit II [Bacillus badius]
MHLHKYEKLWLAFGISSLVLFLVIVGVNAFVAGNQPPSSAKTVDPGAVEVTAPFDQPGLKKIGDNEYQLVVVTSAFSFDVGTQDKVVEIPKGATVHIVATTKDVVHGFEIAGTNANMMLEPGHISEATQVFRNEGEFTLLCNEYCGSGHHLMHAKIKVVDQS